MGIEYSRGYTPYELQQYTYWDVSQMSKSVERLRRRWGERFGMFVKADDFIEAFLVEKNQGLRIFSHFDPSRQGQVPTIELIGSLVLSCCDEEERRVNYIFNLMDMDADSMLSQTELEMLLQALTRGVARMKQIRAPPFELIEHVVSDALEHSQHTLTSGTGISSNGRILPAGYMDATRFLLYLKDDDSCRQYLTALQQRTTSDDVEDLYRQQGTLLLELAEIDARLDERDTQKERKAADEANYERERGGDIKKGLLVPLRAPDDIDPSSDEDDDEDRTWSWSEDDTAAFANRVRRAAHASARAALLKVEEDDHCLSPSFSNKPTQPAVTGLDKQLERRARRARERAENAIVDINDIDVFQRCAKNRIRGFNPSASTSADIAVLTEFWRNFESIDRDDEDRIYLDIDSFQDLFEALLVLIPDADTIKALEDIPHTRNGAYALADVIEWWRIRSQRERAKLTPAELALREESDALELHTKVFANNYFKLKDLISSRLELTRHREHSHEALAPSVQKQSDNEAIATENEIDPNAENQSERTDIDDDSSRKMSKESESMTNDSVSPVEMLVAPPQRSSHTTASASIALSVGKVQTTETKIRICVHSTSANEKLCSNKDKDQQKISQDIRVALAALQKADITASELLALEDKRAALDVNETNRAPKSMNWVAWIDIPARQDVSAANLDKLAREIEAAASCLPYDYSHPYFDNVRCDIIAIPIESKVTSRIRQDNNHMSPVHPSDNYLRLQVYRDTDPLEELESGFPEDSRPSSLLGEISIVMELGKSLSELMRLSAEYFDAPDRMYGPSCDDLGTDDADPRRYRQSHRAQRQSILDKLKEIATLTPEKLRDTLESFGLSTVGAFAPSTDGRGRGGDAARARLRSVLLRKAARLGFGELSTFGERIVHRIFDRFDSTTRDGVLDLHEFCAMSRELGEAPPADILEYERLISDSKLLSKQSADGSLGITRSGLLFHYEDRGGLAADSKQLGIGSLDDHIEAKVSITAKFDALAAQRLEKAIAVSSREHNSAEWFSSALLSKIFRLFTPRAAGLKVDAHLDPIMFCLRFVQNYFIDRECSRLSDLFSADCTPSWLKSPAWLFLTLQKFRERLANGSKGLIPTIRSAVVDYFGQDVWNAQIVQEWYQRSDSWQNTGFEAEPKDEELLLDPLRKTSPIPRTKPREKEKTINDESSSVSASTDTSDDSTVDSLHDDDTYLAKHLFQNIIRRHSNETDLSQEELEASSAEALSSTPGINTAKRHIFSRMAALRDDMTSIEIELGKNVLPRRLRLNLERRRAARKREYAACEKTLERNSRFALARGLRAYDAARSWLYGPRSVNFGSHTLTARCDAQGGLDVVHAKRILPCGRGEATVVDAVRKMKEALPRENARRVKHEIENEIRRLDEEAAAAAFEAMNAHLRRREAELEEEARLYRRGKRLNRRAVVTAAIRGAVDPATEQQHTLAQEVWETLAEIREKRRGSVAYVVALNNLAVALYARGQDMSSLNYLEKAVEYSSKASKIMALALEDTLRADAVAAAAKFAEYHKACLEWDQMIADVVSRTAMQDLERLKKELEISQELRNIKAMDEDDKAKQASLRRILENVKRDRFALQTSVKKLAKAPAIPSEFSYDRHEGVIIIYGILLSNELQIIERTAQPTDPIDEEYREKLYEKCMSILAILSKPARRALQKANNSYYKSRTYEIGDDDDCESSDDENDLYPASEMLTILGIGLELAGFFPPDSPARMREIVKEAEKQAELEESRAKKAAALKKKIERTKQKIEDKKKRREAMELKRLKKKLALMHTFDDETFKLLQKVQPKRAARILKREKRQQDETCRREQREQQQHTQKAELTDKAERKPENLPSPSFSTRLLSTLSLGHTKARGVSPSVSSSSFAPSLPQNPFLSDVSGGLKLP